LCEDDVIKPEDLPRKMLPSHQKSTYRAEVEKGIELDSLLKNIEKHYIIKALKESKGNKTHAAGLLGLKRTTLLARMNSMGIPSDAGRE
ncbi:MAG: hypothetical protein GF388_06120, partial [Candidatus Aegiribacteria sp.]|nr:hypothetical protein [Candidatus Aegiribacteria sp.]MBD3294749.1 hypothetical protein [Candidatus Fermentibacteria bacterium]